MKIQIVDKKASLVCQADSDNLDRVLRDFIASIQETDATMYYLARVIFKDEEQALHISFEKNADNLWSATLYFSITNTHLSEFAPIFELSGGNFVENAEISTLPESLRAYITTQEIPSIQEIPWPACFHCAHTGELLREPFVILPNGLNINLQTQDEGPPIFVAALNPKPEAYVPSPALVTWLHNDASHRVQNRPLLQWKELYEQRWSDFSMQPDSGEYQRWWNKFSQDYAEEIVTDQFEGELITTDTRELTVSATKTNITANIIGTIFNEPAYIANNIPTWETDNAGKPKSFAPINHALMQAIREVRSLPGHWHSVHNSQASQPTSSSSVPETPEEVSSEELLMVLKNYAYYLHTRTQNERNFEEVDAIIARHPQYQRLDAMIKRTGLTRGERRQINQKKLELVNRIKKDFEHDPEILPNDKDHLRRHQQNARLWHSTIRECSANLYAILALYPNDQERAHFTQRALTMPLDPDYQPLRTEDFDRDFQQYLKVRAWAEFAYAMQDKFRQHGQLQAVEIIDMTLLLAFRKAQTAIDEKHLGRIYTAYNQSTAKETLIRAAKQRAANFNCSGSLENDLRQLYQSYAHEELVAGIMWGKNPDIAALHAIFENLSRLLAAKIINTPIHNPNSTQFYGKAGTLFSTPRAPAPTVAHVNVSDEILGIVADRTSRPKPATSSHQHNMTLEPDYHYLSRIALLGGSQTGKSCLILRYSDNIYIETHIASIGSDSRTKTIIQRGYTAKLHIFDTPSSRVQALPRGANGYMICIDSTDQESFMQAKDWHRTLHSYNESPTILLVLTKSDLDDSQKEVSVDDFKIFCETIRCPGVITSAKTGQHVALAFEIMQAMIAAPSLRNLAEEEQAATPAVVDQEQVASFFSRVRGLFSSSTKRPPANSGLPRPSR